MNKATIEATLMAAAENPTPKILNTLMSQLKEMQQPLAEEVNGALELLYEKYDTENEDLSHEESSFFIELATLPVADSSTYRNLLANSIKTLLPPFLSRPPVLRALGVRETAVPLCHVPVRLRKLIALKSGQIIFLNSGRWGMINAIDPIGGVVSVSPFGCTGGTSAIPIENVLVSGVVMENSKDMIKAATPQDKPCISGEDFIRLVRAQAIVPINDNTILNMARNGVGAKMTAEALETWLHSHKTGNASGTRSSAEARSLQEMGTLLKQEPAEKKYTAEEAEKLKLFFTRLLKSTAMREAKFLASAIAGVEAKLSEEQAADVFEPLRDKASFWPAAPSQLLLEPLAVWSELSAKEIEKLARATKTVFGDEYLARLALLLPVKALTQVGTVCDQQTLVDAISGATPYSSDVLLWIWKNRRKQAVSLTGLLSIENIIRALSQTKIPRQWGAAQRELRADFLDSSDFHQTVLDCSDDPAKLAGTLQSALFLSPSERQSLLVKLSRISNELREVIEGGAGSKIMHAGVFEREDQEKKDDRPICTSNASFKRLMAELEDIVNVQQPANRESLKTARAHGDFRENAEFDAAKERRNFLSRRRSELENEIGNLQAMDFRTVKIGDMVEPGCMLTLDCDGVRSVSYLLGAKDADPDKNYVSYRAKMGAALMDHKKGDTVALPGGRNATILGIDPLPEKVLAELD
ncbi:MAG: GreA/GreB family elongation factor [Victivallaceae bacterium]|nr:GreA/GreB family elongation factor [Victivallaceae bacterium]